jgi:hypothetical protein
LNRLATLVVAAGLALGSLGLTACGDSAADDISETSSKPPEVQLPSKLLGLNVGSEDIKSEITETDQPYIDSVGLFSFRQGKNLLQATLQISRFTPEADAESNDFRGAIISRIGTTNPREIRVGDREVFLTSGRNQVVFIWFEERGFFVLTARRDYSFPRTLLRRLLDLDLEV